MNNIKNKSMHKLPNKSLKMDSNVENVPMLIIH